MTKNAAREWAPVPGFYDPLMAGSIDGTDVEPHDNAVVRALRAAYKPNKQVMGEMLHTIFISRLDPDTREEALTRIFSKYGQINRLRIVRDIVTGASKRYAFVEYTDERAAYRAQKEANKAVVDDRSIFVDFELERKLPGWVPRRLGGGFGGNKESGQLRFGGKDRPFKRPIFAASAMPTCTVGTDEDLPDKRWRLAQPRGRSPPVHPRRSRTPEQRAARGDGDRWPRNSIRASRESSSSRPEDACRGWHGRSWRGSNSDSSRYGDSQLSRDGKNTADDVVRSNFRHDGHVSRSHDRHGSTTGRQRSRNRSRTQQ